MMFLGTLPRLFVALILCFLIFRDNLIIEFFPEILCDRIADILIDWLALLIYLLHVNPVFIILGAGLAGYLYGQYLKSTES